MKTKHLTYKTGLRALAFLAFFHSCDTDNVNELQTAASDEYGAYARIIDISTDTNANINNVSASTFDVEIEFVDQESGSLVTDYRIYATFRDNTIVDDDDPDYSINDQVLVYEYSSDSFEEGTTYPTLSFTIAAADAIDALDLDLGLAEGGDQLTYYAEIELSDGRIFGYDNTGTSILSETYYSDAFSYTSQFVCIPDAPPAGDYLVKMQDSYGDGWQGDGIMITIDGTTVLYADIPDYWSTGEGPYSSYETTITIPEGSTSMEWYFTGDTYTSEVSFQIYGPTSGEVIADVEAPSEGLITLNLCKE
ncbi:hypothetical protein [Maribacter polysaccharolyticus]|uniref:hypothetical protein n=1 Tax=Maribacter polysaccharolyticus TaxID=3020831 RepID=UPI00237F58F6|nr:hypothetical protein [Maribacter polysaccharolyticus]MDE3741555.1 hypothetical protein [Maribacter polysaccharolyticus]